MMMLPAQAPLDPPATSLTKRVRSGELRLCRHWTFLTVMNTIQPVSLTLSCRIFKKRSSRKSAGSVSRSSSRASSVGQMLSGQRADLIASESENGQYRCTCPREICGIEQNSVSYKMMWAKSALLNFSSSWFSGRTFAVQGFSSGYSSAEEHYDKPFTSNPNTGL